MAFYPEKLLPKFKVGDPVKVPGVVGVSQVHSIGFSYGVLLPDGATLQVDEQNLKYGLRPGDPVDVDGRHVGEAGLIGRYRFIAHTKTVGDEPAILLENDMGIYAGIVPAAWVKPARRGGG